MHSDVSCVISRRGEFIWTFPEVLLDLGIFEWQRVTPTDEATVVRANFVHLCTETSSEMLLSAEQNS